MRHFTRRPGFVALAPFVLVLGLVATAAPASGSSGARSSRAVSRPPTASVYAQRIVDRAQVAQQATEVNQSPTAALNSPVATPGSYDGTIIRARWWTVDQSEAATYQQLLAQTPAGLQADGQGEVGAPSQPEQFALYRPLRLPSTVYVAMFEVNVVSLNASQSAVGAFAVVVRQPKRPQRENVPVAALRQARLVETKTEGGAIVERRTVTGADAEVLGRAFNRMVVRPGGAHQACPEPGPTSTTVKFLTAHHRWVVAPEWCTGVSVRRDGQHLPELVPTTRYKQLVTKDLRAR